MHPYRSSPRFRSSRLAAGRIGPLLVGLCAGLCLGCSLLVTRPVQEMSDTTAALRAAREVQADTLAPELYRQANEWFFRARKEYKFKNFKFAKDYAEKARRFAEQAEFEAMRNGGNRTGDLPPDPSQAPPSPQNAAQAGGPPAGNPPPGGGPSPYPYPTQTGYPASGPDPQAYSPPPAPELPSTTSGIPGTQTGNPNAVPTPTAAPTPAATPTATK